jgi:hypothetical protein
LFYGPANLGLPGAPLVTASRSKQAKRSAAVTANSWPEGVSAAIKLSVRFIWALRVRFLALRVALKHCFLVYRTCFNAAEPDARQIVTRF